MSMVKGRGEAISCKLKPKPEPMSAPVVSSSSGPKPAPEIIDLTDLLSSDSSVSVSPFDRLPSKVPLPNLDLLFRRRLLGLLLRR